MRGGVIAIGVMVLAGGACAGEARPRTLQATVDADGRVLPIEAGAGPAPTAVAVLAGSPCPIGPSLAPQAARDLVTRVAQAEELQPAFALAVARIESHFGSTALSAKGAYGLMQLTPETARRFAVDLCDPEGNARGGVRFLRLLLARYHNPLTVLAAYNAGEEAVRRARGVPPFPETVRFIADVMNDLAGWPPTATGQPAPDGVATAGAPPNTDPLLIEPAAAAPSAPAATVVARTAEAAPWSAGFVMHIQ